MHQQYVPNERVTRRCAKLWRREIEAGSHDAGDGMINAFARMLKAKKAPPTKEQLDAFEKELAERLMQPVHSDDGEHSYYRASVGTDYHPDQILSEALTAAGLGDGSLDVPVKSHSYLDAGYVRAGFGYRAFGAYHYILTDTLWMVTTLSGTTEEIETLKKIVLEGRLPEIRVEDDDCNLVSNLKQPKRSS
jgi:hypothetical protein